MKDLDIGIINKNIIELKAMMHLLLPKQYTIAYIAQQSGKSKQAVTSYIKNHYLKDREYWYENGKIIVSDKVARDYIVLQGNKYG